MILEVWETLRTVVLELEPELEVMVVVEEDDDDISILPLEVWRTLVAMVMRGESGWECWRSAVG